MNHSLVPNSLPAFTKKFGGHYSVKKTSLFLPIFISLFYLAACTANPENHTAISFKGGTISEKDIFNHLKKIQGADAAVQQLVVYQIFDNKYGATLSTKEIDAEFDKTKDILGDYFEAQLKQAGFTEKTFKEEIRQQLAYKKGLEKNVELKDEDLQKLWASFHPEVKTQLIQLRSETDANEVKKALAADGDFSELAKEKSIEPNVKNDEGKKTFDSGTETIANEVKDASFKLKDGEVSNLITATNPKTMAKEYYLVKMLKNQDKGTDKSHYLDELKEIGTKAKLADPEFIKATISKELKNANVKIKDEDFENSLQSFTKEVPDKEETTATKK